ncbi:hypothetical protein [Nocardioides stalactiti]|uniref:hypothetical protein n=1 Tax=Nocardioides stalactiti TaxID=2755356 RepID=UPI001FE431F6|nr:hypothetical protein [Nocardioides stalactiti]
MEKILLALAALPFGLGFAAAAPSTSSTTAADEVAFTFADPAIIESSGLVARDGLFATVNDSGDGGRVFTVDPATGETVAVTTWVGEPFDVEAIAPTPDGDVLVGDIGDNIDQRDGIELVRVPFGEDGAVTPTSYELRYPDDAHDAEALLVHPRTGQVLVVAKEFIGQVYAAPAELDPDGPNRLREIGEAMPIATDGAFFPDGEHVVLRGYSSATVYRWPSLEEVGEVDLPFQPQGEGIAVDEDGEVFVSSEGQFTEVLRIELPQALQDEIDGVAPPEDEGDPARGDRPADDGVVAPEPDPADRPWWPWWIGGFLAVGVLLGFARFASKK